MRRLLATLALAASAALTPPLAGAQEPERPFQIGFADYLFGTDGGDAWARRAAGAGADSARINVYWSVIGPDRPADPRDPDDPAYDFTAIDRAVRNADAAGLDVLMTILSAPRWAEGPDRPPAEEAPAGTWRPSPAAFGDFARAVARRYSGTWADPLGGGDLPEVDLYSAWNEPNISAYLTPQHVDGENTSAAIYVDLLNAFHDQVKAVNPDATIATGGTAPFGDTEGRRTGPLAFWRRVMCLDGSLEPAPRCAADEPPRFDALAHHPITYLSSPNVPASHPDDATPADFGELVDALRAAEDEGTVPLREGDRPHFAIAPEVWWETKPPQRGGVSFRQQARYTALALHLLWRQGAQGVWFLQVRDAPRRAGEGKLSSYQTGIYTYRGRRKLAYRAVQFPFVTTRKDRQQLTAWGRAPTAGRLVIEARVPGAGWARADSTRVEAGDIFVEDLALRGPAVLRARIDGRRSIPWRQRR